MAITKRHRVSLNYKLAMACNQLESQEETPQEVIQESSSWLLHPALRDGCFIRLKHSFDDGLQHTGTLDKGKAALDVISLTTVKEGQ